MVCRKLKKALKNHPCKKTRRGRYIIDILDSYYDYGEIGIGYYDGKEIIAHPEGFEHPLGDFFYHLIHDDKPLWSFDDRVNEKIMRACGIEEDEESDNNDLFNFTFNLT